ncbi:sulfotransferase family protein [Methyloceanibacter caenitepidi]|uniref:sulfotransferase family protein n=1 Tax=Methyloceanibacter caenitepidi TaxID=1384459 RepID=UPI0005F00FDA|nr:sulfotransferase family protein [Methyloceanibacter caenitepidi]
MTPETSDGKSARTAQRTLVYVAGYGRSGSTLVGRLIASTGQALDVGEVAMAPLFLSKPKSRCSCGARLTACPVWGAVPEELRQLPPRPANRHDHAALLRAILEVSTQQTIVDSSKTAALLAFRPHFLSRTLPVKLYLVHLVRDPRAVVWSVVRDRRTRRDQPSVWRDVLLAAKTSLVWQAANVAAELQGLWFAPDMIRLRYDHFVRFGTPRTLEGILPQGAQEGVTHESGIGDYHSLGGNAMRNEKTVVVRLDDAWRTQMPRHLLYLATVLSFPFIVRYRFGLGPGGAR